MILRYLAHQIRPAFMQFAVAEAPPTEAAKEVAPKGLGESFADFSRSQSDAPTEEKPPEPKVEKPVAKEPEKKPARQPIIPAEALDPKEPKVEVKPKEPVEEPPEDLSKMSPKARENFERMQTKHKGEMEALRTEIETYKKSSVPADQVNPLKAERDKLAAERDRLAAEHAEMLKSIELLNVERAPQFREKFVKGREALVTAAVEKLKRAGGNVEAFKAALQMEEGRAKYTAIEEALTDTPQFIQNQIGMTVSQIEALDAEKQQAILNSAGSLEKWSSEENLRQQQRHQEIQAAQRSRFDQLVPEVAKEALFLRKIPADAEQAEVWNGMVDKILDSGKKLLFEEANFDRFTAASLKAHAYDYLEGAFKKTLERNAELEKQLREMSDSEPGTGGGGGGSSAKRGEGETTSLSASYEKAREAGQIQ